MFLQEAGGGFALLDGLEQAFGAVGGTGEGEGEGFFQRGGSRGQGFHEDGFGAAQVQFAQKGGHLFPERHRFFGVGKYFGKRGQVILIRQSRKSFGGGGASLHVAFAVREQGGELWPEFCQAQRCGQFGGGDLAFVHLIGNDPGQGDDRRLETAHRQPGEGMAGVAIHDFEITRFALMCAQIPRERLRQIVSGRSTVRENLLGGSVPQPDQILLPRRFVGRTIVAGHEEAQPGGNVEWAGTQNAGELLAAGREAADKLRGLVAIGRRARFQKPRIRGVAALHRRVTP